MLATSTQFWNSIASTSFMYINASWPFFFLFLAFLIAFVGAGVITIGLIKGSKKVLK